MQTNNTPAVKGRPGRPRLYNNCLDMDAAIELYFEDCEAGVLRDYIDKRGQLAQRVERIPPTIAGLCRNIGFDDRHALAVYEDREEARFEGFSAVIKRARSRIEELISSGMLNNGLSTIGSIFYLKNHCGYRDQEAPTGNTGIQVIIDGASLTALAGQYSGQAKALPDANAGLLTIDVGSVSRGKVELGEGWE